MPQLKIDITPEAAEQVEQFLVITNQARIARAIKVDRAYGCLNDFDQWLRDQIKYANREELQEVRDKLLDIMEDNDLNLDEYV